MKTYELAIRCAVIFASKRNEAKRKRNFFLFDAKKSVFRLFSHLKQNENEMKRKQNEKEGKRSETKNFWKRNKAKIRSLLISLWSEAKNSKRKAKKNFFFRMSLRNGSRFASFLWSEKNFWAKPAHPTSYLKTNCLSPGKWTPSKPDAKTGRRL